MTVGIVKRKEIELPKNTGNRIGSIIKKGLALEGRLDSIKVQIDDNKQRIIPFAVTHAKKFDMKSATFKSADGEVTVKFTESMEYLEADIPKIKAILGPIFGQMFHTIPTFAVNSDAIPEIEQRLGSDFDRLVKKQETYKHTKDFIALVCDADNPMSKKIRDHVKIVTNKPTVSFNTVKG